MHEGRSGAGKRTRGTKRKEDEERTRNDEESKKNKDIEPLAECSGCARPAHCRWLRLPTLGLRQRGRNAGAGLRPIPYHVLPLCEMGIQQGTTTPAPEVC